MTFHPFSCVALRCAAALSIAACADPSGLDRVSAKLMIGEWSYSRAPGAHPGSPSLNAGLSVAIAIDSASGMRFWGRVSRWFVGDYGLPLDRFGPVSGTIDSTYGVKLQIEAAAVQR